METIEKVILEKLKKDIKELSEKQKFYKNQRKTVKLVGKREMDPSWAASHHSLNRQHLRILYIVYAQLRGVDIKKVDHLRFSEEQTLKEFLSRVDRVFNKYMEEQKNEV